MSKWCPHCGERFPLYFSLCPDCRIDLVDRRPGPAPTPNMDLVRVFLAENEGLVEIAKSLLDGEQIEYLERGWRLQDLFGWGRIWNSYNYVVGPVDFWVCADEAEHARACLEGLGQPASEAAAPSPVDEMG